MTIIETYVIIDYVSYLFCNGELRSGLTDPAD